MTDAGASCGAGFNGLPSDAGITIVGGHEMAETITDQFPSSGWTDTSGEEIGDKCAWISTGQQGASASETMNGQSFPVQSLWSNKFNGGAGGCVQSY
jgi:serine protease